METIGSHPFNCAIRRGFGKTSLLAGPNSSQMQSRLDNVKVLRLDIDKLTEGSLQSKNILTRLLDRTVKGQGDNFLSPIANDRTPEEILVGWDNIFEQNKSKINKVLDKSEMNQRSKFGSRSEAKPWSERREKLYSSFGRGADLTKVDVPMLGQPGRLRPLAIDAAAKYLKSSTNSGLPFMMKKSLVKDIVTNDIDTYYGKYPAVLFTRTQEGGKTRDVWGYPIADTLVEMKYYRPLLSHQLQQPWRAALRNPASLDAAMNKFISNSKKRGLYMLSNDVELFDDSAKRFTQSIAFKSVERLFQEQYHDEIKVIADRFNNIPIVTPDGILTGSHGIPSGSTLTNEVGSIIQYSILDSYNCCSMDDLQIQGDDSVTSCYNPDLVFRAYSESGFKINETKSDVSEIYCTYLQFLYHPDFKTSNGLIGGVYPIYRALNRIVHMERFDNISKEEISGKEYFAIRTISIMENCKHHPLFKEFVEYIWKLDKYNLKVSDLGIRQFVELKRRQEGKDITFSNYTYGDDVQGIRSFETFKLLEELNV